MGALGTTTFVYRLPPSDQRADGAGEHDHRGDAAELRSTVHPLGDDWDQHLYGMEFAYNYSRQRSTGRSPFELNQGSQPTVPLYLLNPKSNRPMDSPAAETFLEEMQQRLAAAWEAIELS